jgi:outer membrane protein
MVDPFTVLFRKLIMYKTGIFQTARPGIVALIISGGFFLSGCIHPFSKSSLDEYVAPSSGSSWKPADDITASSDNTPADTLTDIPENLVTQGANWRLSDIIDVALRNSPNTRQTWYAARSAAADLMVTKSDRYPEINATIGGSRLDNITTERRVSPSNSGLPSSLGLTWLIFDFGGREASIEEKRRTLIAADFAHNAAVQDQVFNVIEAYFTYANAKALEKALDTSMKEASTTLDAANERHNNGLATIADVLQAKTSLSQAILNLENAKGRVKTIRGALATAMGIPANTPYDIADIPMNPPVDKVVTAVDEYIKMAEANSPDLAAQRNRAEASMAHTNVSRSEIYPSLSLGDTVTSAYSDLDSKFKADNNVLLQLKIPIWDGRSRRNTFLKSEQDALAQKAKLQSLRQSIILQVWSSYFTLQTSVERLKAVNDLVASATSSYEVALGRYKEGVGALLDMLTAQSTLMNARAQQISAQSDWYISFSQLARDTGMLWSDNKEENMKMLDKFPAATIEEKQ